MTCIKDKRTEIEIKEDEADIKAATEALRSVDMNDTKTLKDICDEAGIDYAKL